MGKKVLLLILDGWGHSPDPKVSAIDNAKTPFIDGLYKKYPNATLKTDGLAVGLPEGQMGNSEVGHLNLGAGRIVYQDLAKINRAIETKTIAENKVLKAAFNVAKTNNKPIHFLGLLSNGGVHSHSNHLFELLHLAKAENLTELYIHAFTDGRDVDPKSGLLHIKALNAVLKNNPAKLASVTGRYYAMDRDRRWERTKIAFDALTSAKGKHTQNVLKTIENSYENNITDEFLNPIILTDGQGHPTATIKDGDLVIFFNFRTDRGRQLTQALTQNGIPEFNLNPLNLYFVTLTNYDASFKNIKVAFEKDNLKDTLGEVLEAQHKTQLRVAETEKYPHVTFFFSGGRELPFKGERRLLKNSPKVATYDLKPEMSAYDLRDALLPVLHNDPPDFICLNFANGDMVGHTGNMQAAIKACETIDNCVKDIVETALAANYEILLIADHGNCETMVNPDGSPHTAHTTNPVPIIFISPTPKPIKNGILADVAPTILELMKLPKPKAMTQTSLI